MGRSNLSRLLQSCVFTTIVKFSPWKFSSHFLWLITGLYFLANRESREIIRGNIEEVFSRGRSRLERAVIFRSTLRGISRHYFEKLYLAFSADRHWKEYFLERIRLSGRKNLDRLLAERKGLILVTAHFGAVEFLPGYLALLGYRVAIIARFKTQRLKEKCEKKASAVGARIIDAGEKKSFFLALSALKEGKILITQCDEAECWKAIPGRGVQLFGTFFQVDRTAAILQKRSGAPVVFGYVRREEKGRYSAEIEDLGGADGESVVGLGETVLEKLEKLVYAYPDQWYIWKDFQHMKATLREDIGVEDRKSRHLLVTPSTLATIQPPRSFPQVHGQHCRQVSV